jgi:hypothetical protein
MLKLSPKWAPFLLQYPESGMGYWIVSVVLMHGRLFDCVCVDSGYISRIGDSTDIHFKRTILLISSSIVRRTVFELQHVRRQPHLFSFPLPGSLPSGVPLTDTPPIFVEPISIMEPAQVIVP